jgi:class 3 adenylate cyclase
MWRIHRPGIADRRPSHDGPSGPVAQPVHPTYLAEKILMSKTALEGERKQVTVLFADLKGSMELLADRDPDEARQLLDPVLERMMDAVYRYEGTVNQVMGDGIMALFGAPIAHEDHAVRACYAALAMQASVQQYAAEVQRTRGVPIHIRVGLNSGEVVVRSIGSHLHIDYTAVGQTTHLAARMEQMAMPGSTLITADVLRLEEGYVQVTSLGPVPIKGLSTLLEVFEVTRVGPVRTRLQASAARGLTRFVGRDRELDQLRQALEQAGAGQGQVVAVTGEPGVGKSRLFWEFTQSHRTPGWLILESHSVSYGKATAYLPVIDLLKVYCGVDARDDMHRVREKVMGKVLTLDRALDPLLCAILALLEVPVEEQAWQALDPLQRRRHTLEAVKRLLVRESQVQPLLLVFEDLHWIDTETQAVIDLLVGSLPAARVLLLVNYRPEYEHGWGAKTSCTQLRLDRLPPASADAFLKALIGDDPSVAPLTPLLIARTQGNPFFLEESVRALVETGVLVRGRGAYHLATPLDTLQVLAMVQALLAARIDRLLPEDKRLLQAAAVIGPEVPLTLLQAIADLPEAALHGDLGQVVLLSGEAGIGKSRLVQGLKEHVASEPQAWLTPCQCSPYYQHSALYPMIELLERVALRFDREESPQQKLHKLEGFVVQYGLPLAEAVPLFAALLSLPLTTDYAPLALAPEQQKQKTLHALLTIMLRIAAQQPVLFVMEDLHWVDPTTLELLTLLVDQGPTARILALMTFGPDFSPPWTGHAHLTQVTLNRLPRRQAAEMTGRVAHGKALPPEVVEQVMAKTDGVPLFVEELTKMVLESGLLQEQEARYELTGPLLPPCIATAGRGKPPWRGPRQAWRSPARRGSRSSWRWA